MAFAVVSWARGLSRCCVWPGHLAQDCKALNGRLLTYLKRPETVQKLLAYMVGAPPCAPAAGGADRSDDDDEEDEAGPAPAACLRTKHSVTACEVCSAVPFYLHPETLEPPCHSVTACEVCAPPLPAFSPAQRFCHARVAS